LSKFVGESEASVRSLFDRGTLALSIISGGRLRFRFSGLTYPIDSPAYEQATNAVSKCAVLFFDEIDALGQSRGEPGSASAHQSSGGDVCSRRVLAELLIQLNRINAPRADVSICPEQTPEQGRVDDASDADSIYSEYERGEDHDVYPEHVLCNEENPTKCNAARVIFVAATNRPEDCDTALIRRFAIRVLVGQPSKRDRVKILTRFLRDLEHNLSRDHLDYLAKSTEGWTGSDLESLSREAAMAPVRECIRSAALLKKRARRREQRGGDTSCQHEGMARMDPHDEARDHLLEQFQSLRPVSLEDFQTAITFWEEQHLCGGHASHVDGKSMARRSVHYDTSSDEED
jgi:SpoVK/Ycf46/Vps4 family AAA+-type ATPase